MANPRQQTATQTPAPSGNGGGGVTTPPEYTPTKLRDVAGVLRVRGPRPDELAIDPLALRVLIALREEHHTDVKSVIEKIRSNNATAAIEKVTARINKRPFSEIDRMLITTDSGRPDKPAGIYHYLVSTAIDELGGGPVAPTSGTLLPPAAGKDDWKDDTSGLVNSILGTLVQIRSDYFVGLINAVVKKNDLDDLSDEQKRLVVDRLEANPPSLAKGALDESVLGVIRKVRTEWKVREVIDKFQQKEKIPEARFTESVRSQMVEHLMTLGIDDDALSAVDHDEFLALAFDRAAGPLDGHRDPISLTRAQTQVVPWDFTVETFETADQQDIDKKNILAAGALDYVFTFGERLGVFKLADAVVLRWSTGQVHIDDRETQNRLYRYWKLREDRMTSEERAMLYKRVLDKGDAKVLPRMSVNAAFPKLWHKLMTEATEFIKAEEDAATDRAVSRQPIFLATQDLQYNLTDHMTGMAQMQVTEMYHQLKDAFDLLSAREIVAQASAGRRRNVWTVIERLAQEEFDFIPDVASIRTLAVEGNKVFRWIADYVHGAVPDDEFERFKEAAENWIIAAATESRDFTSDEEEDREKDLEEEIDELERDDAGV